MPKLNSIFLGLLVLLCGCSVGTRHPQTLPLNWTAPAQSESVSSEIEHVAEPPFLAPPPVSSPISSPATTPDPQAQTWISLERWSHSNNIRPPTQISFPATTPAFSLTTPAGVLVLQMNSQVARWNGMSLHLGFEPRLIGGKPHVHVLDLRKNIEPLLQSLRLPARPGRVVVIDPGHGGANSGTVSVLDGAAEKGFTLDWARRVEPLLTAAGWRVFLTRTNDVDLGLSNRVAFADMCQADLFISLHFNSAAPSESQSGIETICLTPTGMLSTLTRDYEDDPARVFPNNAFDEQNLQYGMRLHRALLDVAGVDRGVRRARFPGVLRGHNRPAVLLEGGYLSNPHEARRIADPAYRQRLAEAVAAALSDKADIHSNTSSH